MSIKLIVYSIINFFELLLKLDRFSFLIIPKICLNFKSRWKIMKANKVAVIGAGAVGTSIAFESHYSRNM